MKRRDLVHILGGMGISLVCPLASRPAFAADPNHLVVTVMAGGGWDATLFCDPKGNQVQGDNGFINPFNVGEIKSPSVGSPIRYSPILDGYEDIGSYDDLFINHHQKMVVVNGITMSGSHGHGLQDAAAGTRAYPTLGAMVAASYGNNLSNGFISFGGAGGGDDPYGEAAITRISDINSIGLLAQTNTYQTASAYHLIEQAKLRSTQRLQTSLNLPSRRRAVGQLISAMNSPASVSGLMNYIPGELSDGMVGQAELVSAAFASGMSIAGNLKITPFDSHSNNDRHQMQNLQELAAAIAKLWDMAEQNGYDDRLTVLVISEGGRGPFYNTASGKDDINQSSMIIMSKHISGDRVIQATDDLYVANPINPITHDIDESGELILPRHVHRELRQLLEIDSALIDKYPISETNLGLLGG